jgi:N-acetylglucosaminyl-diphospho-decaprenol L-rhamnosyltransferase
MSFRDITIVITSFKSEKKIKNCLKTISQECSVINVENSNDNEHKNKIEQEFNNVKCILSGENAGYGKGNNIGLNEVKTKYALILNPDTELFPETLEKFMQVAKNKPNFAIIGPGITDNKKKYNSSAELHLENVEAVKGFAMFLNLSEFKEIGYFDENFFFFLEEIDLCRRLSKKNKKIYYCKNIPVYHEGGHSHDTYVDYEMELSRNWHWMWSVFYYNKKYNGYLISLIKISPKLIKSFFKVIYFFLIFNKKKRLIYLYRLLGILNSILGKKSWYRPRV